MKNLTFHLPKNYGKIKIEGEESENCIDTEKSAEELKNILSENLPCGMYSQFAENVAADYLERNCNIQTLEKFKEIIDSSKISYMKGIELYRILKRIIIEKGREE